MKTEKEIKFQCAKCGYHLEEHTPLGVPAIFKDGDISICINCGNIAQLRGDILKSIALKALPLKTQVEVGRILWVMGIEQIKMNEERFK